MQPRGPPVTAGRPQHHMLLWPAPCLPSAAAANTCHPGGSKLRPCCTQPQSGTAQQQVTRFAALGQACSWFGLMPWASPHNRLLAYRPNWTAAAGDDRTPQRSPRTDQSPNGWSHAFAVAGVRHPQRPALKAAPHYCSPRMRPRNNTQSGGIQLPLGAAGGLAPTTHAHQTQQTRHAAPHSPAGRAEGLATGPTPQRQRRTPALCAALSCQSGPGRSVQAANQLLINPPQLHRSTQQRRRCGGQAMLCRCVHTQPTAHCSAYRLDLMNCCHAHHATHASHPPATTPVPLLLLHSSLMLPAKCTRRNGPQSRRAHTSPALQCGVTSNTCK